MLTPEGILNVTEARDVNFPKISGNDVKPFAYDHSTGKYIPGANLLTDYLILDGTRTGAISQAQTFTNGIVGPTWKPETDSSAAIKIQNAAGTSDIITVNTLAGRIGINGSPVTVPVSVYQTSDTAGIRIYGFDDVSSETLSIAVNAGGSGFLASTSGMNFSHGTTATFSSLLSTGTVSFQGPSSSRSLYISHANNSVAVGGSTTSPTAFLDLQASDTSRASLRFRSGVEPTTKNQGDVWSTGSDILYYDGTTAKSMVADSPPGGSDTQVQFKYGGGFGGDAGLTYNTTDNELSVAGSVITPAITPPIDSTTAIRITNAGDSDDVLTIDTTNLIVYSSRGTDASNFFLGEVGHRDSTGINCFGVGIGAATGSLSGNNWTAIGHNAGRVSNGQSNWIAIGRNSAYSNTSGGAWGAIGYETAFNNVSGSNWLACGYRTGYGATGSNWTGIGHSTGYGATGNNWTGIGYQVGYNNTESNWTAVGYRAGFNADSASSVLVGFNAGYNESNDDRLHIANSSSKSLLLGDFVNNRVAIGGTALESPTATLDVLGDVLRLRRMSTTSGNEISSQLTSSTSSNRDSGKIKWAWISSTDATRASRADFSTYYTSTERTSLSIGSDSSGSLLSFHDAALTAKPTITGSRGGNAALASLLTELVTLGLITDSTT